MPRHTRSRRSTPSSTEGRLGARPTSRSSGETFAPGTVEPLGLRADRDALLYVPARYQTDQPSPLVVMLHGAGGIAAAGLALIQPFADAAGLLVLAPASRGRTWDMILGGFGPDVAFIDQALQYTFGRYAVDSAQSALAGFSDGASYALSLGLANGDLFSHILAFSPGFIDPPAHVGAPRIFISHGVGDDVLPINRCSRRIVPQLQQAGYTVQYLEFDGGHTIPVEIMQGALAWLQNQTR